MKTLSEKIEQATKEYNDLLKKSNVPLSVDEYVHNKVWRKEHPYFDVAREVNSQIGWRALKQNTIEYELEHLAFKQHP